MSARLPNFAPPTLIDRVVGVFSPRKQLERQAARTQLEWAGGGHKGGRKDRRATRNWRPRERSANDETIEDLPDLRTRSLDLDRNEPVAIGAIATNITNVLGTGLALQSQVDRNVLDLDQEAAADLETRLEREFMLATKSIDFSDRLTWCQTQSVALRSALASGDVFIVRRFKRRPGEVYGLKVQMIEAGRVREAQARKQLDDKNVDGIRYDEAGAAVGYQIFAKHRDDLKGSVSEPVTVSARDARGRRQVLHIIDPTRPDQARGVPYLAPVIEKLKQLSDYSEAEISAAVIAAFFTAFVTPAVPETGNKPLVGEQITNADGSTSSDELRLGKGAIVDLAPGDLVEFANPGRPNQNFDGFVLAVLREIGMALELPLEVLIQSFTSSYSASKAALEMAAQYFKRRRKWFSDGFHQPIYEWAIDEAVAAGRISAPGYFADPALRAAYLGAEWIGPARIQIDPDRESKADERDIKNRVKTRLQVCRERTGGNWEKKHEQLAREENRAREDGLSVQPQPGATGPGLMAPTGGASDESGGDNDDK